MVTGLKHKKRGIIPGESDWLPGPGSLTAISLKKRYAHVIRQTNDGKRMDIQYSDQQIDILINISRLWICFVLDFIRILEQKTSYVIVRGYVAILFGRSRGT
jgi:hypothetical protein